MSLKVKKSISFIKIPCPLCNSEFNTPFMKSKDRYDIMKEYDYLKCNNCNLVFLSSRKVNLNFVPYNLESKMSLGQRIVRYIIINRIKKFKKPKTHGDVRALDFGAGSGNLSAGLKQAGYKTDSYEIDKKSKEFIKKRGLNLVSTLKKGYYDLIVAETVIEHTIHPIKTLELLRLALKDNGVLFLSWPDINSLQARTFKDKWFHLDTPRHLNHFYGNSFNYMLEKAGFKLVHDYHFNLHIDPVGWYWSMVSPKNRNENTSSIKNLIMFSLFVPLTFLTSIFRDSAYVLSVLKKSN